MGNLNHLKGKSIIDLLWEDLDDTMEVLMSTCDQCDTMAGAHTAEYEARHGHRLDCSDYVLEYSIEEYRGRAQGVAYGIALMSNPYLANVDEVRKLAKERYEQRVSGKPMTPLKTRPDVDA